MIFGCADIGVCFGTQTLADRQRLDGLMIDVAADDDGSFCDAFANIFRRDIFLSGRDFLISSVIRPLRAFSSCVIYPPEDLSDFRNRMVL